MSTHDIDLRLLETIEAIHRAGSITAAAHELGLSQPAVSHALRRMRRMFDDQLFVRTASGVNPTPLADHLAASARRIQALVRAELSATLRFEPESLQRTYRLCTTDAAEMVLLPRLIARVRAEAPGVDVATLTLPPRAMAAALEDGVADLALGPFPELAETRLRRERLFRRGFVCVASVTHPRLGDGPLSIESYLAEPHLVVRSSGRTEEVFERFLLDHGLDRRIALTVPHMLSVPSVTAETDLIATVPQSVGRFFAGYPGISVRPVPFEEPVGPPAAVVSQYWSARFDKDPANVWLRRLVGQLFSEGGREDAAPTTERPAH